MSKVTGGHYFISLALVTLTNKIEIVITLFTSCLPWGLNELMHISLLKWKRQKCILAWFLPMLPSTQSIRKEGVCLFSFSLGKVLEFFFSFLSFLFLLFSFLTWPWKNSVFADHILRFLRYRFRRVVGPVVGKEW